MPFWALAHSHTNVTRTGRPPGLYRVSQCVFSHPVSTSRSPCADHHVTVTVRILHYVCQTYAMPSSFTLQTTITSITTKSSNHIVIRSRKGTLRKVRVCHQQCEISSAVWDVRVKHHSFSFSYMEYSFVPFDCECVKPSQTQIKPTKLHVKWTLPSETPILILSLGGFLY